MNKIKIGILIIAILIFLFNCNISLIAQDTSSFNKQKELKNSIYFGPGIFIKNRPNYLAVTGGFTKHLTDDLCMDLGFTIYNKLGKSDDPPNPSIDISLLYNRSFDKNNFNIYAGGGISFNVVNAIGFGIKLKADHRVFNNFSLGAEFRYIFNNFSIYRNPLVFVNALIYLR